MATPQENLQRFQEIANRGLQDRLDADKRARFDEAVRRGLISMPEAEAPQQQGPETTPLSIAEEFAAGVNRGVINIAEFLTTDQINSIARLSGHEGQLVTPLSQTDFAKQYTEPQITQGMEEGLARDVVRTGGEFVGPGASTGAAFRTIAKAAPMLKPLAASPAADVTISALSGSGAAIGQEVGGETGALVGSMALPIGASLGYQNAVKSMAGLRSNFGLKGVQQVADDLALQQIDDLALQQIDDVAARRPIQPKPGDPTPDMALEAAAETPARRPISALFANETPTKQTVRQIIETGADDGVVARKIIDGAGKVRKDPIGKAAIFQGVDEGVVAVVKGSNRADKEAYAKMLNIVQKGMKNKRFSAQNRPSDIVGDSLLERVKAVRNINKQAIKDVRKAAIDLKGKPVNLDDATDSFENVLFGEFGVTPQGNQLDFTGSVFDTELLKKMQKPINDLWADFGKLKANPDGFKAHQFKKVIDQVVDFNNSQKEGYSKAIEDLAKGLRHNVNEALRLTSNEYRVANIKAKDTIDALQGFQKAAGSTLDLTSPNVDKALGVLSRRLLSNVQSRVRLMDSIVDLERTAKNYGARIDDDIYSQVMFVDELENSFGSFAPTSIQGIGEKVAKSGAREAIKDKAIEVTKGQFINEQKRLNVLKELVGRE